MLKPSLKLNDLFRRFLSDRRGVASILGAMAMLVGLGLSVMVIDTGHLYLEKRRLQSAVDAAALAAAGDPSNASAIVAHVLTDRGYAQAATVTTGAYSADTSLSVQNRFDANPASQQNAVRVNESMNTPSMLARVIGGAPQSTIVATATAAQIPVVSFSAGTGLATLSGGQINTVLGGLLGTTLSLSLVNYQALANVNVDALTFLNQLAAQAGVSAGTYGDLANANITMSQLATAITAALNIHPDGNDSAAIDALNLLSLQTPAAVSARGSQIVNTALWQTRQIGTIVVQTPGQVAFNLYDLVAAMARVYGAGHLVSVGSALNVPGVASLTAQMAVGSPMASVAAATIGTSITTAQVRVAINTAVPGLTILGIPLASINLPLYLQVASGTATVAAIPCQTSGTMATISAAAQAATVQIGGASGAALTNFGANPVLTPATISVTIPLLGTITIAISGTFAVAAGPTGNMNFTQADIANNTIHEVAGSDAGTVFSGLGAPGQLTLSVLPLGLILDLGPLTAIIQTLLSNLNGPTDLLLRTLGLRLGVMDVAVHGVRCGTPTLVT
jgi:uncharacterized membrane protein